MQLAWIRQWNCSEGTADKFLQDVLDGKIDYQIDEGMRCYTMNSIVSLYMKLEDEETGSLCPSGEP
jgi:hypothetical protein